MRLLQNQQETMCLILDALKYWYKIDHTHVYGWVKIVSKLHYMCAHGVRDQVGLLQTATRKKTGASA